MSVSVGFDDIDLNSDVVPDERSGGVRGVNASESTVGSGGSKAETPADGPPVVAPIKEGLGSVDREDNTEAEVGHMERRTDPKLDDRVVGDEIGLNDGAVRRDSTCCEKNSGDVEMNFSTFPEEVVVDRGGESISTRDEVEGEVAAVSFMCCGEEGEDQRAGSGLAEVELNTGSGGAVVLDPVYGDTIPMQTEVASGCVQGGVKPDQLLDESSNFVTAGEWKLGNGIENEGTEVHCDTGIPTHLEDAPHINGFGSYGNQGVVTKAPKDIQQPQGMEIENVKQADLKLEYQVEECRTEKEGQFRASDLVWGKVRSHPWWPGQIFDPSDASEKARRYCKKDGFLIAYFGDKTFAWNEASRMKSFQKHFSQMEKQSNTEAFCHAVHCALEEVSRRLEFGLACSCLSEEVYDKLKTQFIVNAGIREESSRRDGGDDYSSAVLFKPVNVVQYLKALALSPCGGTDRLEFVIARAQLLAFNRRKGFCRLPEFEMLGGSLEDGADILVKGERKYSEGVTEDATCIPSSNEQFQFTKGKSVSQDTSSRKGREISGDGVPPSKKERCLSDLTIRSHSNMSNGDGEPEGKAGRHLTSSSSVKKRKAPDSGPDNSRVNDSKVSVSPVAKKQFSRVGESIRRVANQLAMSSPIVKDGPKKTTNKRPSRTKSEKSQRRKVIAAEYPPPEEMLSQLYMASRDPMQGYDFLTSSVSFFSDFRNSCSLENSTLREQNNLTGEGSGKNTGKKLPYLETTETSWFEGMEDSYWTDMIIQSNTGEQVLFEPEIPNVNGSPRIVPEAVLESRQELDAKKETDMIVQSNTKEQVLFKPVTLDDNGSPAVVPEAALESGREFDSKQENAVLNCESDRKPAGRLDEKCEEEYKPTALILNFADLESVPSESHLNNIFSRYGPLNESDTEVLKKSKRAKVIFKRRSDAETAFSSSGKFNTFGPSLVSYRLNYLPSTQRKTTSSATKRSKKSATSVEGNGA